MARTWEMVLGVIVIALSLLLLFFSLFAWQNSSIPPQENFVTICAVIVAALGIGLIHDSTYESKLGGQQESRPKRRPGFWVVIGTVYVGLMVTLTGIGYLVFSTGVPTLPAAEVVVAGAVIIVVGFLLSRRSS